MGEDGTRLARRATITDERRPSSASRARLRSASADMSTVGFVIWSGRGSEELVEVEGMDSEREASEPLLSESTTADSGADMMMRLGLWRNTLNLRDFLSDTASVDQLNANFLKTDIVRRAGERYTGGPNDLLVRGEMGGTACTL